jgi:hypothetical protein
MSAIPDTWEAEIGKIMSQGQSGQKVTKTPPQPQPRSVVHICNTSYEHK